MLSGPGAGREQGAGQECTPTQDDARPEKTSEAEEQTGEHVDGDADHRQQVRVDVTIGQPAHHRADDSLRPAPDARPEQLSYSLSSKTLSEGNSLPLPPK